MKKRIVKLFQTAALVVVMAGVFTACGTKNETKSEKVLSGLYESKQNVAFMSAYPAYTYKQATFGLQTIEVFSDNTYCLTDTNSMYSGTLLFNDDGSHEEVPRGADTVKYYGTCTSTEEDGMISLALTKPTAVVANYSFATQDAAAGYVNTNAWTDAMGTAVGGEEGTLTVEAYLEKVAFPDTTVVVDTANFTFDYVSFAEKAE